MLLMNINIQTIPHKDQRYETPGDWTFEQNDLNILVSETGDWRYDALIALHELVEVILCKHRGIKQEDVDKFDNKFEAERIEKLHRPDDEPGDSPQAPYRREHCTATGIERIMAAELGVDWQTYGDTLSNL
jgi:hypothetical protein